MAIQLSYHEECDQGFQPMYGAALELWLGISGNVTIQGPDGPVEFDQALVLNGLHPTTSRDDPDATPHVTVRLSNEGLRNQNCWYILHWRPNGNSLILARPDYTASNEHRREKRKQKKKRRLQRKAALKKGGDGGRGKRGGGGSGRQPAEV